MGVYSNRSGLGNAVLALQPSPNGLMYDVDAPSWIEELYHILYKDVPVNWNITTATSPSCASADRVAAKRLGRYVGISSLLYSNSHWFTRLTVSDNDSATFSLD